MNAAEPPVSLSPHEVLARELIVERVRSQHAREARASGLGRPARPRRRRRTALVLRRIAERLDPAVAKFSSADAGRARHGDPSEVAPHEGAPRPWSSAPRVPQRHH
ncbi:hypothetical protein BA895_06460 [Humibacillus sp. DSM 29435]|nr:hypothetical protein BA895_06460 [Humibacillus sp. DSM 29435]